MGAIRVNVQNSLPAERLWPAFNCRHNVKASLAAAAQQSRFVLIARLFTLHSFTSVHETSTLKMKSALGNLHSVGLILVYN